MQIDGSCRPSEYLKKGGGSRNLAEKRKQFERERGGVGLMPL